MNKEIKKEWVLSVRGRDQNAMGQSQENAANEKKILGGYVMLLLFFLFCFFFSEMDDL